MFVASFCLDLYSVSLPVHLLRGVLLQTNKAKTRKILLTHGSGEGRGSEDFPYLALGMSMMMKMMMIIGVLVE